MLHVDDIVIGAGLTALGVVLGLPKSRRIIVLEGAAAPILQNYAGGLAVPASRLGRGGLGSYWHGVIAMALHDDFAAAPIDSYTELFHYFYSGIDLTKHLWRDELFVPWRPIRPSRHLRSLEKQRAMTLIGDRASRFEVGPTGDYIVKGENADYRASRIWMAAGTLHTPGIIARSLAWPRRARHVSDHAIGYLGQVARSPETDAILREVRYGRHGIWFPCRYNKSGRALYNLRPARFDFSKLDQGFEMRATFGLPTSRAIAGIAGKSSPGLVSEALFNKFGLFGRSSLYSAYFQTEVSQAYNLREDGRLGELNPSTFRIAATTARRNAPFSNVSLSRQPELFIPGVHLHGSLSDSEVAEIRQDRALAGLSLVDASPWQTIGPDHHSFKLMANAFHKARNI